MLRSIYDFDLISSGKVSLEFAESLFFVIPLGIA